MPRYKDFASPKAGMAAQILDDERRCLDNYLAQVEIFFQQQLLVPNPDRRCPFSRQAAEIKIYATSYYHSTNDDFCGGGS